MKKKYLVYTLIAAMAISVSACGKKDNNTSKTQETSVVSTENTNEETTTETEEPTQEATQQVSETETEPQKDTEEETESESETESEVSANADYDGTYVETLAGKGTISIETENGVTNIQISWPSSAFEVSEWVFSGTFDENGVLTYDNCTKTNYVYSQDESFESEVDYKDGSGSITIKDGILTWDDAEENIASESEFEAI